MHDRTGALMAHPPITCVGELIVDLTSAKPVTSLASAPVFVKAAGGAPANVAVGAARLGVRTAFVGAVGRDSFGTFLTSELRRYGVDTRGIVSTTAGKTRLAFVAVAPTGERDFEFWERRPADEFLRTSDVDLDRLSRSAIVHIGALLLMADPSRRTAFDIARHANRRGRAVSFDPNLRLSLWRSASEAKRVGLQMIRLATILRLNSAEAAFYTGARDLHSAARRLRAYGPSIVVITEGRRGCTIAVGDDCRHMDGFRVRPVDTTGCGDGFLAGLLAGIVRSGIPVAQLTLDDLIPICRSANAVGAMVALAKGAIPSMPSRAQVQRFLKERI